MLNASPNLAEAIFLQEKYGISFGISGSGGDESPKAACLPAFPSVVNPMVLCLVQEAK